MNRFELYEFFQKRMDRVSDRCGKLMVFAVSVFSSFALGFALGGGLTGAELFWATIGILVALFMVIGGMQSAALKRARLIIKTYREAHAQHCADEPRDELIGIFLLGRPA